VSILDLSCNGFGAHGLHDLAEAVKSNFILIHLRIGSTGLTLFQQVNHERHHNQLRSHMTILTAYQRGDGLISRYIDHWLLRRILHMSVVPQLVVE
jgi:hypothetical protein